ncbi:MAG: PAS domain S-box protein, partial [Proteobacteria bacterium]|nr:PAS domain S-box protein [Pseudomonadota bacterium]
MNQRTRSLITVGLIFTILTLFFLFILIRQQKNNLSDMIHTEQYHLQKQINLLLELTVQRHTSGIEYLVAGNLPLLRSFAEKNQNKLSKEAEDLFELFNKENLYFKTIFFVNPENTIFLTIHNPEQADGNVTLLSPMTQEGNRIRKRLSEFEMTKTGLHYRMVHPIFVNQEYIGLMGFDIDAGFFLDQLNPANHADLNKSKQNQTDIALVFPKTELKIPVSPDKAYKFFGNYSLFSYSTSHFQALPGHLHLEEPIQRIKINNVNHAILHGADFKDFSGNIIAWSLLLINIQPSLTVISKIAIIAIIMCAFGLFFFALMLLHKNFGILLKRIVTLNHSLEQGTKELERRVEERTAKLQQEIIARSQADQDLQKERKTLSTILESNPHGIAFINHVGQHLYINSSFTKITGYTLNDIPTKKKWFEKVYPDEDYRKMVSDTWEKDRLHQGIAKTREFRIRCKNGQSKVIEFRANFLKDETIFMFTDITHRRKAEESLQESEKTLKAIFEANPDPVVVYDINGHPIFLNSAFTDFFGWTLNELKGKRIPFVPKDQESIAQTKIKGIYETGNPAKFETKRLNKKGVAIDILLSAAVIKDDPLKYSGMVVNLRDITNLKQAENEKIKAQKIAGEQKKLTLVGQIAGKMAHDFNNILG